MNPIKLLKETVKSFTLSENLPLHNSRKAKKLDKNEFLKDAKNVKSTFTHEDLLPRITSI